MLFDLSLFAIPVLSLASGLFLSFNSLSGTQESSEPAPVLAQKTQSFGTQIRSEFRLDLPILPGLSASSSSPLRAEVSEWRMTSDPPLDEGALRAAAEIVTAGCYSAMYWDAAPSAPIDPLVLAKGSRAPPGEGNSI